MGIAIVALVIAAGAAVFMTISSVDSPTSSDSVLTPIPVPQESVKEIEVSTRNQNLAKLAVEIVIDVYEDKDKDLSVVHNYLNMNFNSKDKRYAFVIDYDTQKILAHPRTDLIGQNSFALMNSEESTESILENLKSQEGVFVHYEFENPETGIVEPKTSWFKLHDGMIFGSGFYN